jgi:hypothetical protein
VRRLLYSYHISQKGNRDKGVTTVVACHDGIKARLKKFDNHIRAISKLVKENLFYYGLLKQIGVMDGHLRADRMCIVKHLI